MRTEEDIYRAMREVVAASVDVEWDTIIVGFSLDGGPFMNFASRMRAGRLKPVDLSAAEAHFKGMLRELYAMTAGAGGRRWHSCIYSLEYSGDFSMDFFCD